MLLNYEIEMLQSALDNPTLIITGTGMPYIYTFHQFIASYLNPNSFAVILNASLHDLNHLVINNYFVNISQMNTSHRNTAYKSGGVFYGSSLIFITDFLSYNIDVSKLSCIFIMNAESISDDSLIAFIIYIFKERNKLGMVRAFSNTPLGISSLGLNSLAKSLGISNVRLFPRFSESVMNSYDDLSVQLVNCKQPDWLEELSIILLDLIKLVSPSPDFIINLLLNSSQFYDQFLSACDILFSGDTFTFYIYLLKLINREKQLDNKESWIYSPTSMLLLEKTEEYLMDAANAAETLGKIKTNENQSINEDDECDWLDSTFTKQFYLSNHKFKKMIEIIEKNKLKKIVIVAVGSAIKNSISKIIKLFELDSNVCIKHMNELLKEPTSIDVIILISANIKLVRITERYCANFEKESQPKIYMLIYRNSLEEQIYLTELAEERRVFERLSSSLASIPKRRDLEIIDLEDEDEEQIYEIKVDVRELRSVLPFYLYRACNRIIIEKLETGDYIFGRWCMERKSIEDFKGSLNSGRLYQQAQRMAYGDAHPVLLIEFNGADLSLLQFETKTEFQKTLIAKFALFIHTFPQFKVLWSSNSLFSAKLVRDLHKKDSLFYCRELRIDPVLQEMLLSIPGISWFRIRRVVREFKTIDEIAFAPLSRLESVLEKDCAKKVYDFFRAPLALPH